MSASGDSGSGGPDPWRVRFGGTTYRVKDEPSLRRLVASGKVPGDAAVQLPGSEAWLAVEQALAPAAADPWSAWEDLDEDAEQSVPPGGVSPASPRVAASQPQPPVLGGPRTAPAPTVPTMSVSLQPPGDEDVEDTGTVDSHIPLPSDEGPGDAPAGSSSARPVERPPPGPDRRRAAAGHTGKVIPFPGPRPGRQQTEGAHALASEPVPFPAREPMPPPPMDLGPLGAAGAAGGSRRQRDGPQPRTNWWRVAAVGALGLVVLGGARMYVSMYTTAEYAPPLPPPTVPPGAEEHLGLIPPGGEAVAAGRVLSETGEDSDRDPDAVVHDPDTYREIERDLRAHMMSGTQDSQDGDALETSLFIELNRMRLSVVRVNVTVLSTVDDIEGGRPESVELRIVLRSDGLELDREIAAAAMVVGKYVQSDDLAVPVLEVAFEGLADDALMRKRIDAELARRLYLGHLPMGDFLDALTR